MPPEEPEGTAPDAFQEAFAKFVTAMNDMDQKMKKAGDTVADAMKAVKPVYNEAGYHSPVNPSFIYYFGDMPPVLDNYYHAVWVDTETKTHHVGNTTGSMFKPEPYTYYDGSGSKQVTHNSGSLDVAYTSTSDGVGGPMMWGHSGKWVKMEPVEVPVKAAPEPQEIKLYEYFADTYLMGKGKPALHMKNTKETHFFWVDTDAKVIYANSDGGVWDELAVTVHTSSTTDKPEAGDIYFDNEVANIWLDGQWNLLKENGVMYLGGAKEEQPKPGVITGKIPIKDIKLTPLPTAGGEIHIKKEAVVPEAKPVELRKYDGGDKVPRVYYVGDTKPLTVPNEGEKKIYWVDTKHANTIYKWTGGEWEPTTYYKVVSEVGDENADDGDLVLGNGELTIFKWGNWTKLESVPMSDVTTEEPVKAKVAETVTLPDGAMVKTAKFKGNTGWKPTIVYVSTEEPDKSVNFTAGYFTFWANPKTGVVHGCSPSGWYPTVYKAGHDGIMATPKGTAQNYWVSVSDDFTSAYQFYGDTWHVLELVGTAVPEVKPAADDVKLYKDSGSPIHYYIAPFGPEGYVGLPNHVKYFAQYWVNSADNTLHHWKPTTKEWIASTSWKVYTDADEAGTDTSLGNVLLLPGKALVGTGKLYKEMDEGTIDPKHLHKAGAAETAKPATPAGKFQRFWYPSTDTVAYVAEFAPTHHKDATYVGSDYFNAYKVLWIDMATKTVYKRTKDLKWEDTGKGVWVGPTEMSNNGGKAGDLAVDAKGQAWLMVGDVAAPMVEEKSLYGAFDIVGENLIVGAEKAEAPVLHPKWEAGTALPLGPLDPTKMQGKFFYHKTGTLAYLADFAPECIKENYYTASSIKIHWINTKTKEVWAWDASKQEWNVSPRVFRTMLNDETVDGDFLLTGGLGALQECKDGVYYTMNSETVGTDALLVVADKMTADAPKKQAGVQVKKYRRSNTVQEYWIGACVPLSAAEKTGNFWVNPELLEIRRWYATKKEWIEAENSKGVAVLTDSVFSQGKPGDVCISHGAVYSWEKNKWVPMELMDTIEVKVAVEPEAEPAEAEPAHGLDLSCHDEGNIYAAKFGSLSHRTYFVKTGQPVPEAGGENHIWVDAKALTVWRWSTSLATWALTKSTVHIKKAGTGTPGKDECTDNDVLVIDDKYSLWVRGDGQWQPFSPTGQPFPGVPAVKAEPAAAAPAAGVLVYGHPVKTERTYYIASGAPKDGVYAHEYAFWVDVTAEVVHRWNAVTGNWIPVASYYVGKEPDEDALFGSVKWVSGGLGVKGFYAKTTMGWKQMAPKTAPFVEDGPAADTVTVYEHPTKDRKYHFGAGTPQDKYAVLTHWWVNTNTGAIYSWNPYMGGWDKSKSAQYTGGLSEVPASGVAGSVVEVDGAMYVKVGGEGWLKMTPLSGDSAKTAKEEAAADAPLLYKAADIEGYEGVDLYISETAPVGVKEKLGTVQFWLNPATGERHELNGLHKWVMVDYKMVGPEGIWAKADTWAVLKGKDGGAWKGEWYIGNKGNWVPMKYVGQWVGGEKPAPKTQVIVFSGKIDASGVSKATVYVSAVEPKEPKTSSKIVFWANPEKGTVHEYFYKDSGGKLTGFWKQKSLFVSGYDLKDNGQKPKNWTVSVSPDHTSVSLFRQVEGKWFDLPLMGPLPEAAETAKPAGGAAGEAWAGTRYFVPVGVPGFSRVYIVSADEPGNIGTDKMALWGKSKQYWINLATGTIMGKNWTGGWEGGGGVHGHLFVGGHAEDKTRNVWLKADGTAHICKNGKWLEMEEIDPQTGLKPGAVTKPVAFTGMNDDTHVKVYVGKAPQDVPEMKTKGGGVLWVDTTSGKTFELLGTGVKGELVWKDLSEHYPWSFFIGKPGTPSEDWVIALSDDCKQLLLSEGGKWNKLTLEGAVEGEAVEIAKPAMSYKYHHNYMHVGTEEQAKAALKVYPKGSQHWVDPQELKLHAWNKANGGFWHELKNIKVCGDVSLKDSGGTHTDWVICLDGELMWVNNSFGKTEWHMLAPLNPLAPEEAPEPVKVTVDPATAHTAAEPAQGHTGTDFDHWKTVGMVAGKGWGKKAAQDEWLKKLMAEGKMAPAAEPPFDLPKISVQKGGIKYGNPYNSGVVTGTLKANDFTSGVVQTPLTVEEPSFKKVSDGCVEIDGVKFYKEGAAALEGAAVALGGGPVAKGSVLDHQGKDATAHGNGALLEPGDMVMIGKKDSGHIGQIVMVAKVTYFVHTEKFYVAYKLDGSWYSALPSEVVLMEKAKGGK